MLAYELLCIFCKKCKAVGEPIHGDRPGEMRKKIHEFFVLNAILKNTEREGHYEITSQ